MKFEIIVDVIDEKQNSQAVKMVEGFCRELPSRMSVKSCSCKVVKKVKKVEKKNGE